MPKVYLENEKLDNGCELMIVFDVNLMLLK